MNTGAIMNGLLTYVTVSDDAPDIPGFHKCYHNDGVVKPSNVYYRQRAGVTLVKCLGCEDSNYGCERCFGIKYVPVDVPVEDIKRSAGCMTGQRCRRCLKLMYKLEARRYQKMRSAVFDGEADALGNIHIHPSMIQSLMNKRVAVGKAFRRWKKA